MVEVFREVRRVLRDDGTCWVNLGDSYTSTAQGTQNAPQTKGSKTSPQQWANRRPFTGLKPKDLVGIPWRVAFALQADGWYLRQDIIWHKPNPMPESVRDRCTKAHEYVFLLSKSERYFYDAEAVSEESSNAGKVISLGPKTLSRAQSVGLGVKPSGNALAETMTVGEKRNRRSVWKIATKPYRGAHFAVMPPDLVEPCIKGGCPEGGTVLDPFAGSGTTLAVATELGRNAIGCELNPDYINLAEERICKVKSKSPLFCQ
jgi:site-specific DNA-methyltransferase (adenine-specific)